MNIKKSAFGCAVSACALAIFVAAAPAVPLWAQAQTKPQQTTPPQTTAPATAPADLPPAQSIIDRHIEAIGGRKAIMGHSSTHMTGTMTIPGAGMTGQLDVYAAKPNRVFSKMTLAGVGEILEGFDGKVGWSISPMTGPMLTSEKELEDRKFDSDFYGDATTDTRYKSIKTVEKTTFEGRPVYKLSLIRPDGKEDFEYFDVETGFRIGRQVTRETPMGPLSSVQVTTEYKKFGDMTHPVSLKVSVGPQQLVLTTTAVEYDNVDPAVFELPPAIKALIK